MAPAVAVYTRLSRDLTGGLQTSTGRQERACRSFASARDWTVAGVWEDVDRSAYLRSVRRPAFEQLIDDVAGGRVAGVVVWKLDRLVRRSSDFERFWSVCEQAGCFLASVTEPIDSSTEIGITIVRILVAFATMESTTKSLRITSKHRELAEQGRPPGRAAFGHTRDYAAIIPSEAALIREAAGRVTGGESIHAVVRSWNQRGVPSPRGGVWHDAVLVKILRAPRLGGQRSLRGQIVAPGCWPAILDPLAAAALRATLATRTRTTGIRPDPALLSGVARCGVCGARLSYDRATPAGGRYRCPGPPNHCGRVSMVAHALDGWASHVAAWRLTQPVGRPDRTTSRRPDALAAEFDAAAGRLRELARDYYVSAAISREEYLEARSGLETLVGATRQEMRTLRHPRNLQPTVPFELMSTREQRETITVLLDAIDVYPIAGRGRCDERLEIRWARNSAPEAPLAEYAWPGSGAGHPTPPAEPRDASWLTAKQAAARLGWKHSKPILALIRRGTLPDVRHNNTHWVKKDDIDRYIESCRIVPRSQNDGRHKDPSRGLPPARYSARRSASPTSDR